jgi:hypothetical protein
MSSGKDNDSLSYFNFGDIVGSSDVNIGNNNTIIKGQQPLTQVQREVLGRLDEFMGLLARYADSVEDPASVRESVAAAEQEVRKPSPRWSIVRTLLRGVIAPVAGAAALTEVISNILDIVSHLLN